MDVYDFVFQQVGYFFEGVGEESERVARHFLSLSHTPPSLFLSGFRFSASLTSVLYVSLYYA